MDIGLLAVYMAPDFSTAATASHPDVKEYYDFDNGQKDNFYGISRITIKPGTNFVPTGRLLVKYEFFTHRWYWRLLLGRFIFRSYR